MISVSVSKTPGGRDIVRMLSSGEVTAADAESIKPVVGPGGPHQGKPILAVIEKGANYSPEARQAFTTFGATEGGAVMPVAVVVPSAPLRVMLSFVIRLSGAAEYTRFFGTEAEGLAWLDQRVEGTAA